VLRVRRDNTLEKQRWSDRYTVETLGHEAAAAADPSRNPNYFYDPFHVAAFGRATINGLPAASGLGLWDTVKQQEWHVSNRINNDRLEKWGFGRVLAEG
jgi:hypothetical protein